MGIQFNRIKIQSTLSAKIVPSGPNWANGTLQATLSASDFYISDFFGALAAVSADGNTAAFGAQRADVSGVVDARALYFFQKTGSTWAQKNKMISPTQTTQDSFARSVAMSLDGKTAAIGAFKQDHMSVSDSSKAYIYVT